MGLVSEAYVTEVGGHRLAAFSSKEDSADVYGNFYHISSRSTLVDLRGFPDVFGDCTLCSFSLFCKSCWVGYLRKVGDE